MKPTKKQNEALYGPSGHDEHGHKPGDIVTYTDHGDVAQGTIIHTRAAGPVREGGPVLKAGHIVESGRGWPKFVPLGKVVE